MSDFQKIMASLADTATKIAPLVGGNPAQAMQAAGALVALYRTVRETVDLTSEQVVMLERERDAAEKRVLAHLDRTAASLADD